jgi:polygalacturonase
MLIFLLVSGFASSAPIQPELASVRPAAAIVNIREHGAAGDGATDDTLAVASAFSAVCAAGGGTIDIPAGTYIIDPAAGPIPLCSHLTVQGTGTLKVKADAGDYQAIFAATPAHSAVDNLTFTGIGIDQNPLENQTATIDVSDAGRHQRVFQVFAGSNLHFERMRLQISGVNAIDVNGSAVSGVYITRNYVVFQKREGQPEFDNSAIYINGDHFHVTDNTFVSTAADAARTAIEVHTGSGVIAGNTVDGFSIGMNLVDLQSSSVTGNHVRNAGYGITLWSLTNMDSVVISGNTVALAQATRAVSSSWGIATAHDPAINGEFANLQISGNIVRYEPESSPRTISGSANYGIGLQALGNIRNAAVVGNEIVRPPVRGIAVGVLDGRYTTTGVSVMQNRIVDAGSNLSAGAVHYSAAISLQGHLSSVDVVRNRLEFQSNPFAGRYSYWSYETGYTFTNVMVAENYTTAADGTPMNGLTWSVVQTYR